jgi:hypothetical protein
MSDRVETPYVLLKETFLFGYLNTIFSFSKKGGPNIRIPIKIDVSAEIKTAAAPTSLPTFASGCCWGLARSTTASRAVLMNSAVHTNAIVSIKTAQSLVDKCNHNANKIARVEATA